MKKQFFFRNIGSILTFAFAGTILSTFAVAGIMFGVCSIFPVHINTPMTFIDNLRFGALISATDPVTILAIFSDLNVDVNLYALVFGESVLNDAVAIVITRTIELYEEAAQVKRVPNQAKLYLISQNKKRQLLVIIHYHLTSICSNNSSLVQPWLQCTSYC